MEKTPQHLQLLLDVKYEPTEISASTLRRVLEDGINRSIGNGLLTSDLDVEVDSHDVQVALLPPRCAVTVRRCTRDGAASGCAFVVAGAPSAAACGIRTASSPCLVASCYSPTWATIE